MAYVSKNTAVVYITEESSEGTAVAPSNASFVSIMNDYEMNGEKELVERDNLTTSIIKEIPRVGIKTCALTLNIEAKANTTEGSAPEAALLFKGALGALRSNTNSHKTVTDTNLNLVVLDGTGNLAVGDFIMIKATNTASDGYHISPISSVTASNSNIGLLIPMAAAPASNTSIAKFVTYYTSNSGHPSLTVTTFLEDALKLQAAGCKVSSMSLEGFETGQIASFNFSLNGMSYAETVAASGLTPTQVAGTPPLVLSACVYKDGVAVPVNSFSVNVENTLGRVTSTCSANGLISQRITEQTITGSFVPYMDTTSVALYSAFDANTEFSLVAILKNPVSGQTKQWEEVVGIFLPRCIITAMPKADQDGVMQYAIEFSASYSSTYSTAMTIGFI